MMSKFFKLSLLEFKYLIILIVLLYYYKFYLYIVPFRIWSVSQAQNIKFENRDLSKIIMFKKSLNRANKFLVGKNKCLIMSLALRCLLKRNSMNSILYLGVINDGFKMRAHAWVEAYGVEVVDKLENFVVLYDIK